MISSEREDEYPKAKICDFGLSNLINPSNGKAQTEVRCGTMGYIAPEMQAVRINFNLTLINV